MSDKCYYGYVRPKAPNRPWSLEKIPLGRSILKSSKSSNVKPGNPVLVDVKVTDDLSLGLNESAVILPLGRYLIKFHAQAEAPINGVVKLSIGKYTTSMYALQSVPSFISGATVVEVTDSTKGFTIVNDGDKPIKLSNLIMSIVRI